MRKVHLIGICGTGMGSLAGLFKTAGWEVRGSDAGTYPPMSDLLAELEIPVMVGFSPTHLDWSPTLVVVGNIARPDNPEAREAERRNLPRTSMAAALSDHFLVDRHPVVVTGTHGKTTTSSLLAWCLEHAGRDPGYLVGGVLARNEGRSFRLGQGPFVIEGDEYETAYFDKGPKFMHYRPRTAVLTSVELDHVEVFPDLPSLVTAFMRFVGLLPADGRLLACADDPTVRQVTDACAASVTSYGTVVEADVRGRVRTTGPDGMTFEVRRGGQSPRSFRSPLTGEHNLRNLTAVVDVLSGLGLDDAEIAAGLASFPGVRRRQEIRDEVDGVLVIDDFAHHPTAVRETINGISARFPGRRLLAVFEPRTNSSRRRLFQEAYAGAFDAADRAIIAPVDHPELAPEDDRLDAGRLARDISDRGTPARHLASVTAIVETVVSDSVSGDVVLVLSNGAFDGFIDRLLAGLAARARRDDASPQDVAPAP